MIKHSFLFILLISISSLSVAQQLRSGFGSKLIFGGNAGLQFGDITLIQVAPTIGYKITDNWIAGVGAKYIYLQDRVFDYSTNIYGGSIFTQYYFLENFVAHSEVEVLNLDAYDPLEDRLERTNVTSVLVGGGVTLPVGGNTYLLILGLWNLNETLQSPYTNPIIRAGIVVGI